VVDKTIPTVVRVAEGFDGGNEAKSFSRGDLLELDFVKSTQKVCATIISSWSQAIIEAGTGYMQLNKEIVIPLGYKGKVVITRPLTEYKVYVTVAELMHDFPRFVRVDKPFFAHCFINHLSDSQGMVGPHYIVVTTFHLRSTKSSQEVM
jgi:hypothetical protein